MQSEQAWVVRSFDAEPELSAHPLPDPKPTDVVIRVNAVGLNFADLLMVQGKYQETPSIPFVPGLEVAGRIEALGSEVQGFALGDRVMAAPIVGGLSDRAVVPHDVLRRIPDSMDDVTAAAFQIVYGTSHLALTRRARLQQGENLLVLGAAGGVGLTAVEIGRELGATVVAAARGEAKIEVAAKAGAHALIDSDHPDLLDVFRQHGPYDVVYDAVGGELGDAAMRCLAPEGRFLVIGFASGDMPKLRPNHLLVKNQSVIGFYWGGYQAFRPDALNESLNELASWHRLGRIAPHISHVLPFDRALEGLDLLRSRTSTGKVVITR